MANKFKNSVEFANTKMLLENYRNIQIAINCRGVDETISEIQGKNTDACSANVDSITAILVNRSLPRAYFQIAFLITATLNQAYSINATFCLPRFLCA